jgi:hypothetical protein
MSSIDLTVTSGIVHLRNRETRQKVQLGRPSKLIGRHARLGGWRGEVFAQRGGRLQSGPIERFRAAVEACASHLLVVTASSAPTSATELEEVPFGVCRRHGGCTLVGGRGLTVSAQPPKQPARVAWNGW